MTGVMAKNRRRSRPKDIEELHMIIAEMGAIHAHMAEGGQDQWYLVWNDTKHCGSDTCFYLRLKNVKADRD